MNKQPLLQFSASHNLHFMYGYYQNCYIRKVLAFLGRLNVMIDIIAVVGLLLQLILTFFILYILSYIHICYLLIVFVFSKDVL